MNCVQKKKDRKSTNVELDKDLVARIENLSDREGWIKRRIHTAALEHFLRMPFDEQRYLINATADGAMLGEFSVEARLADRLGEKAAEGLAAERRKRKGAAG